MGRLRAVQIPPSVPAELSGMVGSVQQRGQVPTASSISRTLRKLFAAELKISSAAGETYTIDKNGLRATCHPQHESQIWPAIIGLIDDLWDRELKAMTLHNVRHDSPCRTILPDIAASHCLTCDQTIISNSAKIKLPPTWDQYLESLDGHERK